MSLQILGSDVAVRFEYSPGRCVTMQILLTGISIEAISVQHLRCKQQSRCFNLTDERLPAARSNHDGAIAGVVLAQIDGVLRERRVDSKDTGVELSEFIIPVFNTAGIEPEFRPDQVVLFAHGNGPRCIRDWVVDVCLALECPHYEVRTEREHSSSVDRCRPRCSRKHQRYGVHLHGTRKVAWITRHSDLWLPA